MKLIFSCPGQMSFIKRKKKKNQPTCKDIVAPPGGTVLVLVSASYSPRRAVLCHLFLSSGTCLCLSGSLHGLIRLYGSNQAVLRPHADTPSSGRFSFLASDLSSSAEMYHEIPGEKPNVEFSFNFYNTWTFMDMSSQCSPTHSFIAWQTLWVDLPPPLGARSLRRASPASSSSLWTRGWGGGNMQVGFRFAGGREGDSDVSCVAASPVPDEL